MGLRLTLRSSLLTRLELTALTLHQKGAPKAAEAERIRVPYGVKLLPLGEFFSLRETSSGVIEIEGDPRIDGIGAGLAGGRLVVEGNCGTAAGAGMTSGHIEIRGSCGSFLAAEMGGGGIEVLGSAGDRVGAALAGQARGMTGGSVVVMGDAGERVGERMRAGVVVIRGSVGARCAARMIAGTLAVGGAIGVGAGFGMRRGTVLCGVAPDKMPLGFADSGDHDLVFLSFLKRSIPHATDMFAVAPSNRARRLVGDLNAGGQGEFLVFS